MDKRRGWLIGALLLLASSAWAGPNKIVTLGPTLLTTTLTTNIYSPPTTTGGTAAPENTTNTFYIIKHCRIVNQTASSATVSLWKDATAGNTSGREVIAQGTSVPANGSIDYYGNLRLDAADTKKFLVGGSGTATALTITCEAEMGID